MVATDEAAKDSFLRVEIHGEVLGRRDGDNAELQIYNYTSCVVLC